MNKKCTNCRLANFPGALVCARCGIVLAETQKNTDSISSRKSGIFTRALVCIAICVSVILGFYLSLIASARSLTIEQENMVRASTSLLREKSFTGEAMLLDNFTVFRSEDNWLNASVAKENAYAATNFPFEIITLYSDFFTYPVDDTERAAILLHEAMHLRGKDEKDAYEFVWKNRKQLGWTDARYSESPVWRNIRQQTRENVPGLFICDFNEFGDCTQ